MKICHIGPEGRLKTGPAAVVADLLKAGATDFHAPDMPPDPAAFDIDALVAGAYDLICVCGKNRLARTLADRRLAARLVFLPAQDPALMPDPEDWAPFAHRDDIRVICFTSKQHQRLARLGVNTFFFRYFPEAAAQSRRDGPPKDPTSPRAVFSPQGDRPSWETVKTLFADMPDLPFHLHLPDDPASQPPIDWEAESAARPLTIAAGDPADCRGLVGAGDIHVASRAFEEVGGASLAAMAAGGCVIAPDTPAMNEYITHGVTGLLYDIDAPQPLDLSGHGAMARRALRTVVDGHREWQWDAENRLSDLLFRAELADPEPYRELGSYVRAGLGGAFPQIPSTRKPPLKVSVAVVCYNSAEVIEGTLRSIFAQTYRNMEIVVVDGQSDDGTLEILERHRDRFDGFVSEPDKGVYDAMNKAARLATGEYVIFINAGDYFHLPTSLEMAMRNALAGLSAWNDLPEFIVGDHIYLDDSGVSALHGAADFDETWAQLRTGRFKPGWWSGIPCHQATLTRRKLLAAEGYDLGYTITADHAFMFTMKARGARFVHCHGVIATYTGGGLSAQNPLQCMRESFRISRANTGDVTAVERLYLQFYGERAILPDPERMDAEADLLRGSGLFHAEWYRARHMGRGSGRGRFFHDPILHYLVVGHAQGAWPHPLFDPHYYLLHNPDAGEPGVNPFVHYLTTGRGQGRPTYAWEDDGRDLSAFKRIEAWRGNDPGAFEDSLRATPRDRLLAVLRGT